MTLLKVDTIEAAREKIFERVKTWSLKTEIKKIDEIDGQVCILAQDLYASNDIPGFRRATVDGYAVVSGDTAGAGEAIPVFLKMAGSVAMGKNADFAVRPGECAYVPTGGMLPQGADAVVMVEYTELVSANAAVYEPVASGAGMAEIGEDAKKGELLLRRGALIRPQEAGALAAAGINSFSVFSPFVISIISTGDELVPPGNEPCPGEVRDINTYALKALALKRGYNIVYSSVLPDDEKQIEAALKEAVAISDLVIISGGSSQGEKDLTAKLIDRVSKPGVFTHGLALKPGKPTILGWDEESKTLFAGLPGHPVSAMMVFELLLGWIPDKLFDRPPAFAIPARVSCNMPGSPGRTLCQPVTLRFEDGCYSAQPIFGKSGMITTLTRADGYIIVDLNKEGLKKGENVLVYLL